MYKNDICMLITISSSSTWKHILANNTGHYQETGDSQDIHNETNFRLRYNITRLRYHEREQILHKLQHYFKFMVVRHPIDRLVSAYIDKLANRATNEFYEHKIGVRVLQRLRPNAPEEVKQSGRGVTFPEFVKYLTEVHMTDRHFDTYQDHCHPCLINYDYIGKLETQKTDSNFIITKHLSGYGAGTNLHTSPQGGASMSKYQPLFDTVTPEMIHQFVAVYQRDMDMFGYSFTFRNKYNVFTACGNQELGECC